MYHSLHYICCTKLQKTYLSLTGQYSPIHVKTCSSIHDPHHCFHMTYPHSHQFETMHWDIGGTLGRKIINYACFALNKFASLYITLYCNDQPSVVFKFSFPIFSTLIYPICTSIRQSWNYTFKPPSSPSPTNLSD